MSAESERRAAVMKGENVSSTGRLASGERFAERFDVRDFLGAGGEFDVYLAFDRVRGEEVALKVLVLPGDPRFGQTVASAVADDMAARKEGLASLWALHRETLDDIDHDVAIARVWEVSCEGDPSQWFVVEECVRAAFTLSDWLRIEKDPRRVHRALATLGRLLAQLHERGVIHRDVHGGNVLVDADGRLWFTDFSHAIRPLHRGAFALLSPWNAPEERAHSPLTASADVYGFARLVIEALERSLRSSRPSPMELRLRAMRARYVDCAPEARGSLVSLLDELAAIERALWPAPRGARRERRWWIAALALVGLSAAAMSGRRGERAGAAARAEVPVTVVRMNGGSSPSELRWSDVPAAPSAVDGALREPWRAARGAASARPALDIAGSSALRERGANSDRLANYAANEFLREAQLRASRGFASACLRRVYALYEPPSEASATFRVRLSPASDLRGGRVDAVDLLRSSGLDARTAQCLRARIANIAAADPGQTIETELSLRIATGDRAQAALLR